MKPAFPALCAVLAACHAARDTAMLPPNPSSTQAMKSMIDSLLERSKERRAQHERLIAMQEEAAPPEVDEYEEGEPAEANPARAVEGALPLTPKLTAVPAASKAPTALELQAAEAKVTRLTNEVMRLRGMSVNCTDETVSARPFC